MVRRDHCKGSRSGKRVTGANLIILVAALMGSAYVLAMALRSSEYWWVAWICLLPLFWAIRTLKPIGASLSGAIWGIGFFLFSIFGTEAVLSSTSISLTLLAIVPALYCGLGSLLTRRVGFNPLLLALSWIGVEFAFKPLGLQNGLLAETQADSTHFHWIGRLLGYIFIAFLVACINATLLAVLSNVRISIPHEKSIFKGLSNSEICPAVLTFLLCQLSTLHQIYPRAPPIPNRIRIWHI